MECNKDEAERAKDIAVRKFTEKDLAGAKKFALKAQTLNPNLDGISYMLTALDVHIAANNKVGGEMDMYGILGVESSANYETIRKQHKQLLLWLHPDKNKFIGANEAFHFMSEAYSVLSDKAKRSAYDTKRRIKMVQKVHSQSGISSGPTNLWPSQQKFSTQSGVSVPQTSAVRTAYQKVPAQGVFAASRVAKQTVRNLSKSPSQQKVPPQSEGAAVSSGANGYYKESSSNPSRRKSKKTATSQSFFSNCQTFWTVCTACYMKFEYWRIYLSQKLKCPSCSKGFIANEVLPPSNLAPLKPEELHQQSPSSSGPRVSGLDDPLCGASARWTPQFGTAVYCSTPSSSAAHAQARIQPVNASLKRAREESQGTGSWERNSSLGSDPRGGGPTGRPFPGHGSCGYTQDPKRGGFGQEGKSCCQREREIKSVRERHQAKFAKSMKEARCDSTSSDDQLGPQFKKYPLAASAGGVEQGAPEFSVPDPDVHVFDLDRSERPAAMRSM